MAIVITTTSTKNVGAVPPEKTPDLGNRDILSRNTWVYPWITKQYTELENKKPWIMKQESLSRLLHVKFLCFPISRIFWSILCILLRVDNVSHLSRRQTSPYLPIYCCIPCLFLSVGNFHTQTQNAKHFPPPLHKRKKVSLSFLSCEDDYLDCNVRWSAEIPPSITLS